MSMQAIEEIRAGLVAGRVIPYLGPELLCLAEPPAGVPAAPQQLVERLIAKTSVPHKIRGNLTAAAQYIENFKHRKTLNGLMREAFAADVVPTPLQSWLAALPRLPLVVDTWYDASFQRALHERTDWGQVQGLSQAEHHGRWVAYYRADGLEAGPAEAEQWSLLLYKPLGGIQPAANFIVSDSDHVEVLTEIDIQSPIPARVQTLRCGRHFLFLGCRFRNQLERSFARQIMKRSSDRHWAVLSGDLTRNEARFLAEQGIAVIDVALQDFAAALLQAPVQACSA